MTTPITSFDGDYRFLSNFMYVTVKLDGVDYPSVEHAFQAAKTPHPYERRIFTSAAMADDRQNGRNILHAGKAKRAGKKVTLRADWDAVKLQVMEDLLRQKFAVPKFATLLRATGDAPIVEGNYWGDTFWGVYKGTGENHLGRLLMQIRSEL